MALYEECLRMLMFLDRLTPAGRLLPIESVGRQLTTRSYSKDPCSRCK